MNIRIAAALSVAVITTLTGCSTGTAQRSADDKYRQTWAASYADTSCSAFLGDMTTAQRWASAADMLTSARNKMDGGSGLPSDSQITRFEADVATACGAAQTMPITEAAVAVYLMDSSYKP